MIYDARMAPYTDIVDNGKSWTYNHLDIVASSTYQSLTPGPTYTFGEAETVDQTEYLPLMCDGKRTGMLMRQEGLRVYVRFERIRRPTYPATPPVRTTKTATSSYMTSEPPSVTPTTR